MIDSLNSIRETEITVVTQGDPIVGKGYVIKESGGIALVEVRMISESCDLGFTSPFPEILGHSEAPRLTVHLDCDYMRVFENKIIEDEHTLIELPEYKSWNIFTISANRYDIRVCLTR